MARYVRPRRSAPITSAACCVRPAAAGARRTPPPGGSRPASYATSRTRRSPTPSGCRRRSACSRQQTGSSGAARGTWTSSTSSAASPRLPEEKLKVAFHNDQGDVEAVFSGMHVDGKVSLEHTIFERDFSYLAQTVTSATPKLTIPSPSMVHYRGGRAAIDSTVYPDLESSGPISPPPTARRCAGWASSAARTCSSTTRASRT